MLKSYSIAFMILVSLTLIGVSVYSYVQCWPDSLWYGKMTFWAWATGMCG